MTTLALPALAPAGRAAAVGAGATGLLSALRVVPLLSPGMTMGSLLTGPDCPDEVDIFYMMQDA